MISLILVATYFCFYTWDNLFDTTGEFVHKGKWNNFLFLVTEYWDTQQLFVLADHWLFDLLHIEVMLLRMKKVKVTIC